MRRVRHMIEAIKHIIIIFIDHAANTFIAKQITLASSNTDKLNLRLVRVSAYLSQFRLKIKYRLDKEHVIFDALSRLFSDSDQAIMNKNVDVLNLNNYHDDIEDFELDQMYAYQSILIAMSSKFRTKLLDEYQEEQC